MLSTADIAEGIDVPELNVPDPSSIDFRAAIDRACNRQLGWIDEHRNIWQWSGFLPAQDTTLLVGRWSGVVAPGPYYLGPSYSKGGPIYVPRYFTIAAGQDSVVEYRPGETFDTTNGFWLAEKFFTEDGRKELVEATEDAFFKLVDALRKAERKVHSRVR